MPQEQTMTQVTVSQLAEVLGVDVTKLTAQLNEAGIKAASGDDPVSNEDKKKLLSYLRSTHGKGESEATAPAQVTLRRKSHSELRIHGSGPRATTKTVNVEIRKRRTYVKREVLEVIRRLWLVIGVPDVIDFGRSAKRQAAGCVHRDFCVGVMNSERSTASTNRLIKKITEKTGIDPEVLAFTVEQLEANEQAVFVYEMSA